MAVIQPNLVIPSEFQARIANGELWRDGGVLRRAANGTIALILKDGPASDKDNKTIEKAVETAKKVNIIQLVKEHKTATTIGIVGAVVAVGTGIYLYLDKKKSDRTEVEMEEYVFEFQNALSKYIKLATKGALSSDDIEVLLKVLDKLEIGIEKENITLDFSIGELSILINCILNYTKIVAGANNYKLNDYDIFTATNFRHHLETQKKIIDFVA